MQLSAHLLLVAAATATVGHAAVWKITILDIGTRENTCSRQVQACQNNCGGPSLAPMAFCNSTTMAWGCGCLNNTPNMAVWNWPVPTADCSGSLNVCNTNCGASNATSACFENCTKTHMCNTEDAPVSYTSSSDVAIAPLYVGPAVSYKGDNLGNLNDGNDRSGLSTSSSAPAQSASNTNTQEAPKGAATSITSVAATAFQLTSVTVFAAIAAAMMI
ncbi:hypothetical protein GGI04_001042 [Coemansia thaxteri]|nr:hypothetical protein GGI04_001042 [Coemansia thaxteri]